MRKKPVFPRLRLTFLLMVTGALGLVPYSYFWAQKPIKLADKQIIELKRGTSLSTLAKELRNKNIITDEYRFKLYVKVFGGFEKAQAGTYSFIGDISPSKVLETITSGKTYKELKITVTIPEGFTLEQTLRRLEAKNIAPYSVLKRIAYDKKFIDSLGINADNLEGYLYPETYSFFEEKPKPKRVFKTMVKEFFKQLPDNYEKMVNSQGLTLTEAVTFASLIEKETMKQFEKPLVSEVIWNRIKRKMPLGIDAAIIYGIKNYDGDIKWKDLRNRNNPYNTRIHRGLPPGPIGAVSKTSLQSVLVPTKHGYLYYVLIPGRNGEHKFTKTLSEHNKYVKKLINYKRR